MSALLLLFNIISLVMMTICTVVLYYHRVKNKASKCFIVCQVLTINWILCHIMDYMVDNIIIKYLFNFVGYVSVTTIGAVFFLFSLYYVNSSIANNRIFKCLLFVPSIGFLVALVTDPVLHLFYKTFEVGNTVGGAGFYITVFYTYILLISGICNMMYKNLKSFQYKKLQLLLISLSAVIPLVVNSFSLVNIMYTGYDFTTLSFTASSIMVFVAVYKFEFVSTSPFAVEQLMSTMKEAVIISDKKGMVTFVNEALKNEFNLTDNVLYKKVSYIFDSIEILLADNKSKIKFRNFYNCEKVDKIMIKCCNKKYFYINRINVVANGRKKAEVFLFTDITQYRNFADELSEKNRKLSAANERLINMNIISQNLAIEKERVRIAQELHDSLGHNLVSVMTLLKLSLISNENKEDEIQQALSLSEALLSDIRSCVSGIKETAEIGVLAKIQSLINNLGNAGNSIELSIIGEELPSHIFAGNAVFSVVREAVTNALRHGNADKINVIIKFHSTDIKVYVLDNGKGCEKIVVNHGLRGMKEKVYALGGSIDFSSVPNNGFNVIFTLPVEVNTID